MTGRDWQPGDVLVSNGERGIVATNPFNGRLYVDMASGRCRRPDELAPDARPLAVIDPEDREQVDRLEALMHSFADPADALREFINPKPRIEEPRGHFAVVEDADGGRWVNYRDPRIQYPHERPWVGGALGSGDFREWSDIDAVRVLSEGVQP